MCRVAITPFELLQKILCKSFNGRTLYDYSFVLKLRVITVNSGFSITTMCRVAITPFELGVAKNFMQKF